MKKIKLKLITLILVVLLLVFLSTSRAEIIYLKAGGEIEGKIIDENEEFIRIKTKMGLVNLDRQRIKSIEEKEIPPEQIYTPKELYEIKAGEIEEFDAQAHYELGLFCIESGLYREAEKELRLAQELEPALEKEIEESLQIIDEAKARQIYEQALKFYNQSDYERARTYLKKIAIEFSETEIAKEAASMITQIEKEEILKKAKEAKMPTIAGSVIIIPQDYPTLKEAIIKAESGTTILIKEGEYREEGILRLKSGITLKGAGADLTKITIGREGIKFEDIQNRKPVSKITIENMTFILQGQPIKLEFTEDIKFKNCIITGLRIALYILASKNIEIESCTISGLYTGISLGHGPSSISIRNSIIAMNKKYNIFVADLDKTGISWVNPVTGEEVAEERKEKILEDFKDVSLTLFYNDVWGAKYDYYRCSPGKNDISEDPQFVGDGDYHLKPASPCIDAGDPDAKYNDADSSRADMGALPYLTLEEEAP